MHPLNPQTSSIDGIFLVGMAIGWFLISRTSRSQRKRIQMMMGLSKKPFSSLFPEPSKN